MKRQKKISKLKILYRLLLVSSLILNVFGYHRQLVHAVGKLPAIKRFATACMIDGVKYRVNKYWGGE